MALNMNVDVYRCEGLLTALLSFLYSVLYFSLPKPRIHLGGQYGQKSPQRRRTMKLTNPSIANPRAFGLAFNAVIASALLLKADKSETYAARIFTFDIEDPTTMIHLTGPAIALKLTIGIEQSADGKQSFLVNGQVETSKKDVMDADLMQQMIDAGFQIGTITLMATGRHGVSFWDLGSDAALALIKILGSDIVPTKLSVNGPTIDISAVPDIMAKIGKALVVPTIDHLPAGEGDPQRLQA